MSKFFVQFLVKVVILSSKHRKKTVTKVTVFFQRCVPRAERDAHFVRDVSFESEVCLSARDQGTHHITATKGSNITMRSITSLWRSQNITKTKLSNRASNTTKRQVVRPAFFVGYIVDLQPTIYDYHSLAHNE